MQQQSVDAVAPRHLQLACPAYGTTCLMCLESLNSTCQRAPVGHCGVGSDIHSSTLRPSIFTVQLTGLLAMLLKRYALAHHIRLQGSADATRDTAGHWSIG
jgi:hypothetical protein